MYGLAKIAQYYKLRKEAARGFNLQRMEEMVSKIPKEFIHEPLTSVQRVNLSRFDNQYGKEIRKISPKFQEFHRETSKQYIDPIRSVQYNASRNPDLFHYVDKGRELNRSFLQGNLSEHGLHGQAGFLFPKEIRGLSQYHGKNIYDSPQMKELLQQFKDDTSEFRRMNERFLKDVPTSNLTDVNSKAYKEYLRVVGRPGQNAFNTREYIDHVFYASNPGFRFNLEDLGSNTPGSGRGPTSKLFGAKRKNYIWLPEDFNIQK